jgi:hypothetical protein
LRGYFSYQFISKFDDRYDDRDDEAECGGNDLRKLAQTPELEIEIDNGERPAGDVRVRQHFVMSDKHSPDHRSKSQDKSEDHRRQIVPGNLDQIFHEHRQKERNREGDQPTPDAIKLLSFVAKRPGAAQFYTRRERKNKKYQDYGKHQEAGDIPSRKENKPYEKQEKRPEQREGEKFHWFYYSILDEKGAIN